MLARLRSRLDDDGFTLVEVMISLVIFALISTVAAVGLLSNLRSAGSNRARVTAADLALKEIETVRSAFMSQAQQAGPTTVLQNLVENPQPNGTEGGPTMDTVVQGRAYKVWRDAEWEPLNDTAGPCDGLAGGASKPLAYLRVTVTVVWANMGSTTPVTNTTLLTPPLGTYKDGQGHLKVKVTDINAAPLTNIDVNVYQTTPKVLVQTGATGPDGCAFFAYLTPGNYTVEVTKPGYVTTDWLNLFSYPTSVTANNVTSVPVSYTPQADLQLAFDPAAVPTPYAAPVNATMSYYSPNLPVTGSPTWTGWQRARSTLPAPTLPLLHPWPDSYGVAAWAGDCYDSDPGFYPPASRQKFVPVVGSPMSTPVTGALVAVKISGAAIGQTFYAEHAKFIPVTPPTSPVTYTTTLACPATAAANDTLGTAMGEILTFPAGTVASGTTAANILLPYGIWTIRSTTGNKVVTVTVTPTSTYPMAVTLT